MKVALLGYGAEGKSSESYFSARGDLVRVFDNFTAADIPSFNLEQFDLVLRSPSVPPLPRHPYSSQTKYFFDHCSAPIIGVTGTKGKGTTCTIIAAILESVKQALPPAPDHPIIAAERQPLYANSAIHLVGNIGRPALDTLDNVRNYDVVVYELSSFQLWDLEKSPHVAVVLRIEPDHLNVHKNYQDYVDAKANIALHQTRDDACIYFAPNPDSAAIAVKSPGRQLPYPVEYPPATLNQVLDSLALIGPHNRENTQAALLAVAALLDLTLSELLDKYHGQIVTALQNCHGLPHRLEFVQAAGGVEYYDDSFSTNAPSQKVALASFPGRPIVLIAGGRDKTANADLPEIAAQIAATPNLAQVVLIGESGHELAKILSNSPESVVRFTTCETFPEAVSTANNAAIALTKSTNSAANPAPATSSASTATSSAPASSPVVLLSPAAASFDMFENAYARGDQFKQLVNDLITASSSAAESAASPIAESTTSVEPSAPSSPRGSA